MARYLTIEDGREYLWDFDENRILLVTYGDTENIRQVEFSTDDTEGPTTWTSEVMTNLTTGNKYVQVPNEFLNGEYSRLVCYVIAEDETGQHTRTKEIFRIKKRQQPEDYEITFTDRVYIRDLKAIAELYRDQAKSYSESAAASSTQAGQYNAGALASKNAAEQSAQQANQSMTLSKQYSEASSESASQSAATFNAMKEYVGSESNPSSALGQIYTAKENAKQEVTEHAESTKAGVIDPYVENTTKPAIDAFTEAQKKELDTYEKSKESELDTYNESQKSELNTHTASMKSQLDGYTTAKEQDISEFTEQKKSEVQGVYQTDLNELKGEKVDKDGIKQITRRNTEFFVEGKNLFNKNAVEDGFISNTNGLLYEHTTYKASEYIAVNAGDTLYIRGAFMGHNAFYNKNKQYVCGVDLSGNYSVVVPENVSFIRVTTYASELDTCMISVTPADFYVPYEAPKIPSHEVEGLVNLEESVRELDESVHAVTVKNMLNPNTFTEGAYISAEGAFIESTVYSVSDYIPIRKGETLTLYDELLSEQNMRMFAAFNSNKQIIKELGSNAPVSSITQSGDMAFVRVSIQTDYVGTLMFMSVKPDRFIPYGEIIVNPSFATATMIFGRFFINPAASCPINFPPSAAIFG